MRLSKHNYLKLTNSSIRVFDTEYWIIPYDSLTTEYNRYYVKDIRIDYLKTTLKFSFSEGSLVIVAAAIDLITILIEEIIDIYPEYGSSDDGYIIINSTFRLELTELNQYTWSMLNINNIWIKVNTLELFTSPAILRLLQKDILHLSYKGDREDLNLIINNYGNF